MNTEKPAAKPTLGRPSKYDPTKLPAIISLMSEGASLVEVAVMLGISRETLYQWVDTYPDFSDTIKKGKELCNAWWEGEARKALMLRDKDFNATLWYMNMKNRFGWSDKQESYTSTAKSHDEWVKEMSQ